MNRFPILAWASGNPMVKRDESAPKYPSREAKGNDKMNFKDSGKNY